MRAGNSAGSLRGIALVAFALWLALRQADLVLKSLQSAGGSGGYGAGDLGPLNPDELQIHVRVLLDVWGESRAVSHLALGVYTALDLAFIAAFTLLFLRLFAMLPPPVSASPAIRRAILLGPRFVVALAAFDVLEDALRVWIVAGDDSRWLVVGAAWGATILKLLALAVVLFLLVRARVVRGAAAPPLRWTPDRRWALARMRIPLVLVGAWSLLVIFDPTGQVADTFRRWLDSPEQFATSAAFTLAGVVLLGLATWTTARRAILPGFRITAHTPSALRWGGLAIVLVVAAVAAGLSNLLGLVIVIAVVFALQGIALWLERWHDDSVEQRDVQEAVQMERLAYLAAAPEAGQREEVRHLTRGLSVWPLLALLLGLVSAWSAPPIVLLALGEDEARATVAAVGTVVALASLPLVAFLAPALLGAREGGEAEPGRPGRRIKLWRWRVPLWPDGLERRHAVVAAVCFVLCGLAIGWPLDLPVLAGPVAMTAVVFAAFIVLLGEAQRYGDTHPPPSGLTLVGFARVPVTLFLLIALGLASIVDDGSYHDVHRNGNARADDRGGIALTDAFAGWKKRNCADRGGRARTIPLVLVASQGGGIRSAYWTSSVMTDLLEPRRASPAICPSAEPFDQVFAMGGASGGSVGLTAYAGRADARTASGNWFRDSMGDYDFVAVPTTWALLVDLPRSLIGWQGPDRARRFEEAWEEQEPTLADDFFQTQTADRPLLMLSGTQVETGCRINMSRLRLTVPTQSESQGECAALLERPAVAPGANPSLPVAPLTSDLLDYACGSSLNRSSVALSSARFPYVSPSGRLEKCEGDATTQVVDGGYAENTGGQPILNLWDRLEPLVAAHNRRRDVPLIVPIFVEIDNHYSKAAKAGAVARTQQLLVPPVTAGRADKLDDRGVEQLANARFSVGLRGAPHPCTIGRVEGQRFVRIAPTTSPGVQAPLGWTLSTMAMKDLDDQRRSALAEAPARRLGKIVRGEIGACPVAEKKIGPRAEARGP